MLENSAENISCLLSDMVVLARVEALPSRTKAKLSRSTTTSKHSALVVR